jgi:subtilase family serine protease
MRSFARMTAIAIVALVPFAAMSGSPAAGAIAPRGALPDLAIVSLGTAVSGDCTSIGYNANMTNAGAVDAAPVDVAFYGDTHTLTTLQRPSLAPGEYEHTWQFTVHWSTPVSGTHTITVMLDPKNVLVESNEDNNTLSSTFTCP